MAKHWRVGEGGCQEGAPEALVVPIMTIQNHRLSTFGRMPCAVRYGILPVCSPSKICEIALRVAGGTDGQGNMQTDTMSLDETDDSVS